MSKAGEGKEGVREARVGVRQGEGGEGSRAGGDERAR